MATTQTTTGLRGQARRVVVAWRVGLVLRLGAGATLAALAIGCGASRSSSPVAPTPVSPAAIMGPSRLTGTQLAVWFNARQPRPSGVYAASVPIENLAQYFVEEGSAEGVTGDVAFMQSIVETGWFRFNGSVPAWKNNFAGIGATDTNPDPAVFPDARTGVRAQIQHLRAYADPSAYGCSVPPLHNSCVDPRFDLVSPQGQGADLESDGQR
jgi:hypothetical protein